MLTSPTQWGFEASRWLIPGDPVTAIATTVVKVVGVAASFIWLIARPWVAIGFVSDLFPRTEDPSMNVLIKFASFAVASFTYFWAFEVFVVLAVWQGYKLLTKVWNTVRTAVKEHGGIKGVGVGLWRSIAVFFEPLFYGAWTKKVTEVGVKYGPSDPSLLRFFRKRKMDPDEIIETEAHEDEAEVNPRVLKVIRGRKTPDQAMLRKYEGKQLPLPYKDHDEYGMVPGQYYLTEFSIDEHHAQRAGKHWDITWRHPVWGIIDRGVSKHSKLPTLGEPIRFIKSDDGHGHELMANPSIIPDGMRGAGTSKVVYQGRALMWVDPKSHHLHIITDKGDAFALIRPKGSDEHMMVRLKNSPKGGAKVLHRERKMNMKDISRHPEKIHNIAASGYYGSVKIDGAMFWLVKENDEVYLISRRPAHVNNAPVPHKDGYLGINREIWIPGLYEAMENVPNGTAIQVEVYSPGKGKYASSHARTAALLNMNPVDSILEQEKNGRLVVKLLDVDEYAHKSTSKLTGREELALRQQIADSTGRFLHVPAVRMTPEGVEALWEREKMMGREGIVLRPMDDRSLPSYKVKAAETWDFQITGIAPVRAKRASTVRSRKEIESSRNPGSKWLPEGTPLGAGYITYTTDKGAVGKAGSGLTDEQRRDMWENPEAYLGRDNVVFEDGMYKAKDTTKVLAWVEVRGMTKSEQTGVVRAPVVEDVRFDKEPVAR